MEIIQPNRRGNMELLQPQDQFFEEQMSEKFQQVLQTWLNNTENTKSILSMIKNNGRRFNIDLDDIREKSENGNDCAKYIIKKPQISIKFLERSLNELIDELNPDMKQKQKGGRSDVRNQNKFEYKIGIIGNLGSNHLNPRGLMSSKINQLISCKGIVTRVSMVRPKMTQSVHYVQATKKPFIKQYYDEFNLAEDKSIGLPRGFPTKDHEGNPMICEFGYCTFKDFQKIVLQEMPERAPTGKLPRSIEAIIMQDLIDKVKPGDRIAITGVYKPLKSEKTKMSGVFRQVLIATNIDNLNKKQKEILFDYEDLNDFKKVSKTENLFTQMSSSIGPSIQGHEQIKKGILLMLVGGTEKNLENGTHLRGDVNILMVGDPGTAKSQLLRAVMNIKPGTINTTGRGSTGVGLTAAVVHDRDSGERNLEAGAMVLGDRGIVCIDEFDKMNEIDRVAIHEVMEQQTVTIAKAGIHTTLNARCSVFAAANPIYGEYQQDISPAKNISLPDSLLSRFDLIFIVLDEKDEKKDRIIAERVTKNHRYISNHKEDYNPQEQDTYDEPSMETNQESEDIFLKYNDLTHNKKSQKIFSKRFLQKYIKYAKTIKPYLSKNASDAISKEWTKLRNEDLVDHQKQGNAKVMPITIRTLETIIRLATAHAKLHLQKTISIDDCRVAAQLLRTSLFSNNVDEEELHFDEKSDDYFAPETPSVKSKTKSLKTPSHISKTVTQQKSTSSRRRQKKKTPPKQEKQEEPLQKDLTKKFSKMKLKDDAHVLEKSMDEFILASFSVTDDNLKHVFKKIIECANLSDKDSISKDDLWAYIQQNSILTDKGFIENINIMKKALNQLEDNGKIVQGTDDNMIYLL